MASALTKFGHLCRELRSVNNRTMGDQAEEMGIDVAFISAIETGGKTPMKDYVERFGNWLNLNQTDRRALQKRTEAAVLSFPPSKYITKNSSSVRLFRKISKMAPTQIRNFRKQGLGENKDDG
jgi:transcriptional regulator with XRE-family HTH domain